MSEPDTPDPAEPPTGDRIYYGRNGSPTVTVALPFSKIEVTEDADLRSAVVEVIGLVRRLADASSRSRADAKADLAEVARAADELLERLAD